MLEDMAWRICRLGGYGLEDMGWSICRLRGYGLEDMARSILCKLQIFLQYYKDVANHMENANPNDDDMENVGFKTRSALTKEVRVVDMLGGIHSELFFQDGFLPNDVNIKIRLVRNKDAFCLMSSAAGAAFKVRILECKLYVRKVKLSPSVFLAHAKALEVGNAKFPIRRVV